MLLCGGETGVVDRVPGELPGHLVLSVQLLSRVRLFDPMDCSMPGFPVHHQLSELAQTHVPSSQGCHPTISPSVFPSPPAFNLSQLQGLFK